MSLNVVRIQLDVVDVVDKILSFFFLKCKIIIKIKSIFASLNKSIDKIGFRIFLELKTANMVNFEFFHFLNIFNNKAILLHYFTTDLNKKNRNLQELNKSCDFLSLFLE
jgi:hypothetical protein